MSKTRVNRKIPSSEILILRHSKARVLVPSAKPFLYTSGGCTVESRFMSQADVVVALSRKYGK